MSDNQIGAICVAATVCVVVICLTIYHTFKKP